MVASGKSFRAAPQNGANNITIAYSCDVTGVAFAQINLCQITTDLGDSFNNPSGPSIGAATSTGTVSLSGNRATLCVVGSTYLFPNQPETSPKLCTPLT